MHSAPARDPAGGPVLDKDADEEMHLTQPGVCLCFGDESEPNHPGTLYITTRSVHWLSDTDMGKGFKTAFRSITMHAVSRDTETFPHACIYMQVESGESAGAYEEEEDEEADGTLELRIVPADAACLEAVFQALCDCAALNPDADDEDGDEEGGFFCNEEEILAGAGGDERADILSRFDAMLQIPSSEGVEEMIVNDPERFQDDEDEP